MSLVEAAIAANRFGFGARPGQLETLADNPWDWLRAQIRQPVAPAGDMPMTRAALDVLIAVQSAPDEESRKPPQEEARALRDRDRAAHIQSAIASDTPFRERLVKFWTNHFTVAYAQTYVMPFAGAYEAEAIRPFATGRFRDLLGAVVHHPAMLFYLDNVRSIGPNSKYGQKAGVGLNENLGRELMELHTLGVDGGYTQADVRALAMILTGWTPGRAKDPPGTVFAFRPTGHEPGPKTFLGRTYPEAGEAEGEAALDALAAHPSTARHIATQLARHFIADDPPQDAVDRLAKTFRDTGGDLAAVSEALIDSPEAWRPERRKFKSPLDLVVSAARGFDLAEAGPAAVNWARRLGQKIYDAPSPQGWPDRESDWLAPELVMERIEWSYQVIPRLVADQSPLPFAEALLGPTLSEQTRDVLRGAPSQREGMALALLSPEFQRR
ncbi:DUF1800 family protein [Inquilinus sp. Marseille-Q2685]|uniref:DUF1800 domain-containing protein n=1 Tax=Inquilinus sp. Marseille-Q2685 TaxID=2866581 RepID=UPI001CE41CAF|nr:DUF1800 domain-containing protein [Inquilinus sp. Marseille-Q2685]